MFRNRVPRHQPPALADSGGVVLAPPAGTPLRVLCVDDNRDAADSLGILLRMVGFEVAVCYDGATALTVARSFLPDACVLDLTMPCIDGCELAEMLAGDFADRPLLVAVTACGQPADHTRTAAVGFDLHLVKPADPQRLLDVLFERERRDHPARTPPTAV